LCVKPSLSSSLVNRKLASSSLAFLPREVRLLLGFFDLIHCGWEREVLDLAGRDALFFLLLLDGVVHVYVLVNSKFLKVLIKLVETVAHLVSSSN